MCTRSWPAAFGGSHRRYFAWRWPLLRGPVGCILVESNEEELDAATYPVPAGGAQSSARRSWPTSVPHPPRHNLEVVSCTLAPVGPLLAYSGIDTRQQQAVVVVAHARSGRLRFSFVLGDPHPPFFLQWSACGTRLLCLRCVGMRLGPGHALGMRPGCLRSAPESLAWAAQPRGWARCSRLTAPSPPPCSASPCHCSNWQGGMVALRALDLGPLLLPPQEQERLGLGGNFEVLLCTARPLFLSASPTSTRVLWHGNGLNLGLCDAATNVSEDGSEHDCFFVNPALCRAQVCVCSCCTSWLWQAPRRCLPRDSSTMTAQEC